MPKRKARSSEREVDSHSDTTEDEQIDSAVPTPSKKQKTLKPENGGGRNITVPVPVPAPAKKWGNRKPIAQVLAEKKAAGLAKYLQTKHNTTGPGDADVVMDDVDTTSDSDASDESDREDDENDDESTDSDDSTDSYESTDSNKSNDRSLKDPIIETFGLDNLKKYGYIDYINYESPLLPGEFFQRDPEYTKEAVLVPDDIWATPIHPVFKMANFLDCDKDAYELLLPSLRLATGFFTEPALQYYLWGIFVDSLHVKIPGGKTSWFQEPSLGTIEQRNIFRIMARLQSCMKFNFAPFDKDDEDCFAVTGIDTWAVRIYRDKAVGFRAWKGPTWTTFPVRCTLDIEFMSALRGNEKAKSLPGVDTFDPVARKRRTQYHLALTLVHELAHALYLATEQHDYSTRTFYAYPERRKPGQKRPNLLPIEPFYKNDRLAELGYALEAKLFDGAIFSTGDRDFSDTRLPQSVLASPVYGLYVVRFPGAEQFNLMDEECRGTPAEYGIAYRTLYPVPMDYVHRFFTKRFWKRVAPRYGIQAYHAPRYVGVRMDLQPPDHNVKVIDNPAPPSPPPKKTVLDEPPPHIDTVQPVED